MRINSTEIGARPEIINSLAPLPTEATVEKSLHPDKGLLMDTCHCHPGTFARPFDASS